MDDLSLALTAVADPTRRSILRRLAVAPLAVGDLAEPFHISQQAVSKHLAVLERARLIEKRREGRQQICRLTPAPLDEIQTWTADCRRVFEANFRRLDSLLQDMKAERSRAATGRKARKPRGRT